MIAYLSGILAEKDITRVVVECGGVGYEVFIPISTFDRLPAEGEHVKLFTHHEVREDDQILFGFASAAERDAKRIATIKGIGRKTAERIVVELRDKINPIEALANATSATSKEQGAVLRDAMLALSALGFSEEIARAKVQQVLAADPSLSDTQAILKKALSS